MKRITLPTLLTSLLLFLAACGPNSEKEKVELNQNETVETNQKADPIEVAEEDKVAKSYAVSGMVCEFGCAKFIEEEVSAYFGVVDFSVDYEAETAEIVYDKSKTNSGEIIAFVEGLNDGKYSMTEVDPSLENAPKVNNNSADSASLGDAAEVRIPRMESFKFSFPKVITYFMRRL